MANDKQEVSTQFFKDKKGHIVLLQWPNILLYGWIIFKALSLVVAKGHLKSGFEQLSMSFLFAWAYLELRSGVNNFRKLLGLIVLIALVVSYFK